MLETILEKILNWILGTFVEKFKSDQIHLAILSGKIDISDVLIKKDIMQYFWLPFKLKIGSIGKIMLRIPWTKITSAPVDIIISDILIVVEPEDRQNWS